MRATVSAPPAPAWNTVPLKSRLTGTTPPSSALKYLAASTLKSAVQGTCSTTVVWSSKGGTLARACVQSRLRSVCDQRAGSPNSSARRRRSASSYRRRCASIRTWQSSATECTRSSMRFATRSFTPMVGVTQKGTASAPSTANVRSGIADHVGTCSEVCEERGDGAPDLGAAGEPPPARAHEADQRVALVDGHDEVVGRRTDPVHEQRLDVRLEVSERRVRRLELGPRVEAELRLGRTGRARVARDHPAEPAAPREERQADRNVQ